MTDESIDTENARFFFKDIEDRNNQMIAIMHQYTGYVIISISLIWTVISIVFTLAYENKCLSISQIIGVLSVIALNSSIILLMVWRYYIHYVDNEIVKNYPRLICFEHALIGFPITSNCPSIFNQLVQKIPCWKEWFEKHDTNWDYQYYIIKQLVNSKRMGYRGHNLFDNITFYLCGVVFLIEVVLSIMNSYTLYLLISSAFTLVLIFLFSYILYYYRQQEPTVNDFKMADKDYGRKNDRQNHIVKCKEGKIMSRLREVFFPLGFLSFGIWAFCILCIVFIYLGLMAINQNTAGSTGTLWNSGGFFLMSLGIGGLIFAINFHNSFNTDEKINKINEKLDRIADYIKNKY